MNFNAIIERDLETGLLVGSVPEIPGAHTQGETFEEVRANLAEVIALLHSEDTSTLLTLASHMKSMSNLSLDFGMCYFLTPNT